MVEAIQEHWGLNDSLLHQYWNFVSNAAQGKFGKSFKWPAEDIMDLIKARLVSSLQLTLTALVLASVVAVALGVLTAIKRTHHGTT